MVNPNDLYRFTRCRPGDIAFITQDEPGLEGNIDRLVRVVQESPGWRETDGFVWEIEPLGGPLPFLNKTTDTIELGTVGITHPDGWLRPVRSSDGVDEILQIAGMPTQHHI